MTTLSDLTERLEKAERADRDLSRDINRHFGVIGHPTSSIDHAVALALREAPGCLWSVEAGGDGDFGATITLGDTPYVSDWHRSTPAIAVLIALFRALRSHTESQS